jgi:hypothetical protein
MDSPNSVTDLIISWVCLLATQNSWRHEMWCARTHGVMSSLLRELITNWVHRLICKVFRVLSASLGELMTPWVLLQQNSWRHELSQERTHDTVRWKIPERFFENRFCEQISCDVTRATSIRSTKNVDRNCSPSKNFPTALHPVLSSSCMIYR